MPPFDNNHNFGRGVSPFDNIHSVRAIGVQGAKKSPRDFKTLMELFIPCAAGVEASVKRQLQTLGYGNCPAFEGRVRVEGDWADVARLNVFLRAGERVLLSVGRFPARTFDELFEGVFALPWEEFLTPHAQILLNGKCRKSALMAVKSSGGVVKKAILKRLQEKLGTRVFDEKGERAVVDLFLYEDVAALSLDTTGEGLHRRGYRVRTYDAPLRETTAAAMIESAYFREGRPLADPFCGSGTLPIEAALIAKNIAPGAKREFDFLRWKCAPEVLPRAREEARAGERPAKSQIYAADISGRAVEIARFHAERAGVKDCITFKVADARDFRSVEKNGVLVSNPPYGERLKDADLFGLYRDFGRAFRALEGWNCAFLSAYGQAERAFGRADRKRGLKNAGLDCTLYSYYPSAK